MRAHSRKRPALAATPFLNSLGGRLRELRLYKLLTAVGTVLTLFGILISRQTSPEENHPLRQIYTFCQNLKMFCHIILHPVNI